MNTLNQTTLPRQFLTGSMIALAHGILLLLIILNSGRTLQIPLKETIVMMVPSTISPTQSEPRPATPEKQIIPADTTTAVVPQIITPATQSELVTLAVARNDAQVATSAPVTTIAPSQAEPVVPRLVSSVEYIQAPTADYPPMARRMGEEGRVIMQVLVNDKGHAEKVEIIKSSGSARLDESARLALLRALFKPYFEDGKAMMVLATASINFSLRG